MTTLAAKAISLARRDLGRFRYHLGAKPPLTGDVPAGATWESDCSGWLRRVLHRVGIPIPDGSTVQHVWCRLHGHEVPVSVALGPQGAGLLLFMVARHGDPGHVALSIGRGRTLECRGGHGVCEVDATTNVKHRHWDAACKIEAMFLPLPD
jgi:cell wall-associated NlpC family hydrolase